MGLFLRPNNVWEWPDGTYLNQSSFRNWRRLNPDNPTSCDNEPNGYRGCSSQIIANATQISGCHNVSREPLGTWFDKDQTKSKWFYICQRIFRESTTFAPGKFTNQEILGLAQALKVIPVPLEHEIDVLRNLLCSSIFKFEVLLLLH